MALKCKILINKLSKSLTLTDIQLKYITLTKCQPTFSKLCLHKEVISSSNYRTSNSYSNNPKQQLANNMLIANSHSKCKVCSNIA